MIASRSGDSTPAHVRRCTRRSIVAGALATALWRGPQGPARAAAQQAPAIEWSLMAPIPVLRTEAQGCAVGGKLIVFGGYDKWSPPVPTARVDAYDPATDSWTQLPDLPVPLTHAGVAVDGDLVHIVGGNPWIDGAERYATTAAWTYDTVEQSWTALPSLPQARGSGILALLGRELHYFGGWTTEQDERGDHWVLNLDGGTEWIASTPLLNPRTHFGGAVAGGTIYALGGQVGPASTAIAKSWLHAWDPATARWREAATLPHVWSHISATTVELDGRIVVLAGETAPGYLIADVAFYDPASDAWAMSTPMPAVPMASVAGVIDGAIYCSACSFMPWAVYPAALFRGVIAGGA